jgi:hypothetical protein
LAWEKGLLRFQINQEPLARGEPAKIDSETTQTTRPGSIVDIGNSACRPGGGVPCCPGSW